MGKKITDEELITALLLHSTQKEAAEALGITEQTITTRKKSSSFVRLYNECQQEIIHSATQKLANAAAASADLLIATRDNPDADIFLRTNIAKDILRLARDYVAVDELQRRLSLIENGAQNEIDSLDGRTESYRTFNID